MNLIQKIANRKAVKLANEVPNTIYPTIEDQIEVYSYGYQIIYGTLFQIVLVLILSMVLDILLPAIIIAITFTTFRLIAGGFHFSTYKLCTVSSLIMILTSALISKFYYNVISILPLLILTIIVTLYVIIRYVPRDTPSKRIINTNEIKKFKKWSFVYIIIWVGFIFANWLLNCKLIIVSSCFGLLLELFSISKVGYNFFKKIDSK